MILDQAFAEFILFYFVGLTLSPLVHFFQRWSATAQHVAKVWNKNWPENFDRFETFFCIFLQLKSGLNNKSSSIGKPEGIWWT